MAQLRSLGSDVLFANRDEAAALLGQSGMRAWSRLLELAPLVVVKDGAAGCRVLHRPAAAESAEAVAAVKLVERDAVVASLCPSDWGEAEERILEVDRSVSQLLELAGESHYGYKYNLFTAVRSH